VKINPSGATEVDLKGSQAEKKEKDEKPKYVLPPDKKKLIILLCMCMVLSQTTRQNVIALLPPFCKDNFPQFAGLASGLLLCSY